MAATAITAATAATAAVESAGVALRAVRSPRASSAIGRLGIPVTVLASLIVVAAGVVTIVPEAHAQVGAPIGAPTGLPRGLPAGAHGSYGGYDYAQGGNGLAPPVGNWRSPGLDSNGFGSSTSVRTRSVPAPREEARQWAPGASGPIDPRYSPTPNQNGLRDPRVDPVADRHRNDRVAEPRLAATRPIKPSAAVSDSIEHLRNLVEQGTQHETGMGAPKSLSRAFDLYCEAAGQGYADALLRMAWMYAEGNGVEKSRAAAYTLFSRAARFGADEGTRLAKRFSSDQEVLPVCLKGTVVERGRVERPATREELAAFAPKVDNGMLGVNNPLSAERRRFTQIVINEAGKYRLDPRLVLAVMLTESGFDTNARSARNAHGLMQLLPETAERFGVRNIDDPVQNIRGGMAYIRWLLSYFRGDVALVLAAYNAGEGAVDKHGGVPPFAETLAYVQRIRSLYPFDRHPYDATATANASKLSPAPTPTAVATTTDLPGQGPIARN
ncbi:MAG: lytic transglycosylase domain-containing protein [Lautropia sp.]